MVPYKSKRKATKTGFRSKTDSNANPVRQPSASIQSTNQHTLMTQTSTRYPQTTLCLPLSTLLGYFTSCHHTPHAMRHHVSLAFTHPPTIASPGGLLSRTCSGVVSSTFLASSLHTIRLPFTPTLIPYWQ